mgnify:CR=1 FL=1
MWAFLLLLFAVYAYVGRPRPSAVAWEANPAAAMTLARESGRPVLLKFEAAWCGVCERMDREVFSDARVGEALKGWVTVRVDADREQDLVDQHDVEGLPTFVALAPDGRVIGRQVGGMSVDEFIAFVRNVAPAATTQPRP